MKIYRYFAIIMPLLLQGMDDISPRDMPSFNKEKPYFAEASKDRLKRDERAQIDVRTPQGVISCVITSSVAVRVHLNIKFDNGNKN